MRDGERGRNILWAVRDVEPANQKTTRKQIFGSIFYFSVLDVIVK